jgi:hypothetical protein
MKKNLAELKSQLGNVNKSVSDHINRIGWYNLYHLYDRVLVQIDSHTI